MSTERSKFENDFDGLDFYISLDWESICQDFDLVSGDITPCQREVLDNAKKSIKEVMLSFIEQNSKRFTIKKNIKFAISDYDNEDYYGSEKCERRENYIYKYFLDEDIIKEEWFEDRLKHTNVEILEELLKMLS